ncbi:MAG: cyclic nucleotide-binding domain-containing protein, partial [Actinobacteria bacterium]|nr:cyclic nucleotide-binding domain-containing protein [Actinomycetota bacterium]
MPHGLLDRIGEERVQDLLATARRRRFARNEVVFHRGDPAEALHVVQSGRFAAQAMTPLGDT